MRSLPLLAAAALPILACEGTGAERSSFVPIDTINGTPVVRNGASGIWGDGGAWRLKEEFRLGGPDGPPEVLFGNFLLATTIGPDGHLYVLDHQSQEVRVFDGDGVYRLTFGGTGQGPGELSSAAAMVWDDLDRLWIANAFDGRYTVFDADGRLLKTTPIRTRRSVNRFLYQMHFDGSDGFIDHMGADGGVRLLRRDTTGQVEDTLVLLEHPYEREGPSLPAFRLSEEARSVLGNFRPRLVWTIAPDGTVWTGRTDELRLVQLNLEGDTLRVVEAEHREPAFSSEERNIVERARQELEEDVPLAPSILQSIFVLDDGTVLAQIAAEMNEPGDVFDVFDREGRFLGSMRWPVAPHPSAVHASKGDTIVAVTLDELDVPYIVRATLNRGRDGQ